MDDSTVNVGTRPPPANLCPATDSTYPNYPNSPDTGRLMSLRRDPLSLPHCSCLQGQSRQPLARPLARKPPAQAHTIRLGGSDRWQGRPAVPSATCPAPPGEPAPTHHQPLRTVRRGYAVGAGRPFFPSPCHCPMPPAPVTLARTRPTRDSAGHTASRPGGCG
jgi:hypothetical protein